MAGQSQSDTATQYHAGGEVVALTIDRDYVAADVDAAADRGVDRAVVDAVRAQGADVGGGIVVLGIASVTPAIEQALTPADALAPVYVDPSGDRVVLLPEIRVEVDDADEGRAVRCELDALHDDVEVTRDRGDRLTLRARSGRGLDALAVANRLFEVARPAMAQPGMKRLITS